MKSRSDSAMLAENATVLASLAYPDHVAHYASARCPIEPPHLMSECGEFDPPRTTTETPRMSRRKRVETDTDATAAPESSIDTAAATIEPENGTGDDLAEPTADEIDGIEARELHAQFGDASYVDPPEPDAAEPDAADGPYADNADQHTETDASADWIGPPIQTADEYGNALGGMQAMWDSLDGGNKRGDDVTANLVRRAAKRIVDWEIVHREGETAIGHVLAWLDNREPDAEFESTEEQPDAPASGTLSDIEPIALKTPRDVSLVIASVDDRVKWIEAEAKRLREKTYFDLARTLEADANAIKYSILPELRPQRELPLADIVDIRTSVRRAIEHDVYRELRSVASKVHDNDSLATALDIASERADALLGSLAYKIANYATACAERAYEAGKSVRSHTAEYIAAVSLSALAGKLEDEKTAERADHGE